MMVQAGNGWRRDKWVGAWVNNGQVTGDWTKVGRMQQKTPGLRVKRPGFKFSLAAY